MRPHAGSLYYGTSCNAALFDITSQFKYRLYSNWLLLTPGSLQMTFAPLRHASDVPLFRRLHAPSVSVLKSFPSTKFHNLNMASGAESSPLKTLTRNLLAALIMQRCLCEYAAVFT